MSTAEQKPTAAEIENELRNHIGGGDYWGHPFVRLRFTEGIKHLADRCGAYWLIDVVASYQPEKRVRGEEFQLWSIELDDNGGCVVEMRSDTGMPAIVRQEIEYTDFPIGRFEWYVVGTVDAENGAVMMLKNEY